MSDGTAPRFGRSGGQRDRSRKCAGPVVPPVRAFVGLDMGGPASGSEARPEAPAHLTLQFLGEVAEDRVEGISDAIRTAVRDVPAFEITLEGVGAFPSEHQPRVVWVGVTEGAPQLTVLAARVSDALAHLDLRKDRHEFSPHVTLFRVRSPRDRQRARRLLDGTEAAPPARVVRVTEVALKESCLTREGPIHRTIGAWPLGTATG
jgi:RNA 2',3'-cyclic 3'-phosphodiesterase